MEEGMHTLNLPNKGSGKRSLCYVMIVLFQRRKLNEVYGLPHRWGLACSCHTSYVVLSHTSLGGFSSDAEVLGDYKPHEPMW